MTLHSPPPSRPPVIVQKIAAVAKARVGTRNTLYFRQQRVACAAFVSSCLVKAGAIPRSAASPSASILASRLVKGSWRRVAGPLPINRKAALRAAPGDILIFGSCGGRIAHVGIAIGAGRFVGTSSSRGRVLNWTIQAWRSQRCVRILRRTGR